MNNIYLNLDPGFHPYNEYNVNFKTFNFPSGCEPHIKILDSNDFLEVRNATITHRIRSMDDLMLILQATDALRRTKKVDKIDLFIPYLPFARQDRVMVPGEPLSIKIIADIINSQNYNKVTFFDVHSEVSLALINNSVSIPNYKFVMNSLLSAGSSYRIVCPDTGASKKINDLCKYLKYTDEIIMCNKVRDITTGEIKRVDVFSEETLQPEDLYIVDDICDGGGTFILTAEKLKQKWSWVKVNLIVSHGIFSKGTTLPGIDKIYCTNSFKDLAITDDSVIQTNIFDFI